MLPPRRDESPGECTRIREEIPLVDAGGLGSWRRRRVARHLAGCRECAAELAALRRAVALLDELPAEAAPAGMWERLESAIDASERRPVRPMGRLRRIAPLAAAALLVVGVGLGLRQGSDDRTAQPPAAAYARSHLALSQAGPFAPAAGWDIVALPHSHHEDETGGTPR